MMSDDRVLAALERLEANVERIDRNVARIENLSLSQRVSRLEDEMRRH